MGFTLTVTEVLRALDFLQIITSIAEKKLAIIKYKETQLLASDSKED